MDNYSNFGDLKSGKLVVRKFGIRAFEFGKISGGKMTFGFMVFEGLDFSFLTFEALDFSRMTYGILVLVFRVCTPTDNVRTSQKIIAGCNLQCCIINLDHLMNLLRV